MKRRGFLGSLLAIPAAAAATKVVKSMPEPVADYIVTDVDDTYEQPAVLCNEHGETYIAEGDGIIHTHSVELVSTLDGIFKKVYAERCSEMLPRKARIKR
jgi:hypothetical protein